MASRIKERNKYGASLPKPPKCRGNKEPVWVKDKKKKKDDPTARDEKEPTGGGGKWVCKTKKDPKDPNKPTPPRPHPNPPDPKPPRPPKKVTTPPKLRTKDGASVPLKGKQKNLPEHLKKKILASPGKK